MVGTGQYSSVAEACQTTIREQNRVQPNLEDVEVYRKGYAVYGELYPALKELFPRMAL
jgi:xylulokinase